MKFNDAVEQYNRGVALMERKEYKDAAKAFRVAAEKGVPEAQYNLGLFYANGEGVEMDFGEAVKWFRKAARQGHSEAKEVLKLGESEN